jgi:hypothetical protein
VGSRLPGEPKDLQCFAPVGRSRSRQQKDDKKPRKQARRLPASLTGQRLAQPTLNTEQDCEQHNIRRGSKSTTQQQETGELPEVLLPERRGGRLMKLTKEAHDSAAGVAQAGRYDHHSYSALPQRATCSPAAAATATQLRSGRPVGVTQGQRQATPAFSQDKQAHNTQQKKKGKTHKGNRVTTSREEAKAARKSKH